MNLFALLTSVVFAAGFVALLVRDYAAPRALRSAPRPRVLRARAHFRPLPLTVPVEPRGIEIRPVAMRLVHEAHRLAA